MKIEALIKKMNLKTTKKFICFSIAVYIFCGCNLDYAPSFVSTSITESKEKGFFIFEYQIDSLTIFDKKKTFLIKSVWLEKEHTSTMSLFGTEKFQTNLYNNQFVFDINPVGYFNNDNFLKTWTIEDEEGNDGFGTGNKICLPLSAKKIPMRIRFTVDSAKEHGIFNYGTVKVAEIILKKR